MAQPISAVSVARPTPSQESSRRWLPAILIAFFLVGIVAVVVVWWLVGQNNSQARGEIESDLSALVVPSEVEPTYTLLLLADYPIAQVWQEALQRGASQSAFALWMSGGVRPDRDAITDLITLAQVWRSTSGNEAAALLYAAADVARISPELNDRERAEFMLEIGKALRALNLEAAAVTEWRQASILAHYGPEMPSLYRATLLYDLGSLYSEVGAERLATDARDAVAQVGRDSGVIIVPERVSLPTAAERPAEPEDLLAMRDLRRRAAEEAVRQLGSPNEAQAFALLGDALTAEGTRHRAWVNEQLQAGLPRDVQAALLLYHIDYLQKERVLAWGLGGDHLAAWTERRAEIEISLHDAWNLLEIVRLDQSIQGGDQALATLGQRDWWATRLVQWRLGRDPILDTTQVVASMMPNNADPSGAQSLRLDWIQERFWRVPQEYVGTNRLPE
jgi:hypothetical protein